MTYLEARTAEFAALIATRPDTVTVNGTAYNVVSSGARKEKGMAQAGWQPDQDVTFTMLRTNFVSSALSHRSEFTYSGDTFQLVSITDDDKEPTVRFTAKLKKGPDFVSTSDLSKSALQLCKTRKQASSAMTCGHSRGTRSARLPCLRRRVTIRRSGRRS